MEITILQVNDVHGYLAPHPEIFWHGDRPVIREAGGYARLAALVGGIRAEKPGRVLFCDNGDSLHGTYPAVVTKGQALVPILNALGLDAMTAHWEFAYGPEAVYQRAAELNYPLLAANIYAKDGSERPFPAWLVREVGGVRVGILGLACNIVDKTMPPAFSAGLRFTLGQDEAAELVPRLRSEENVDLVVLLSHLGFPQDMHLLAEVPGIDVCLSGHTHNRLDQPVRQGNTLVIQSGSHGAFLGRLDLQVDGGQVTGWAHRLIEVGADITPDPAVAELVEQALAPHAPQLAEVVGHTQTLLHRGTSLEAPMDTLLLQALAASAGTKLAFSNGWRYGAPIAPGPITLNDLHNIIPTNPPVSTVELTGAELREMLEENLERTYARDPFKQMGGYVKRCLGLHALVRLENPAGSRIQQLFVGSREVQVNRTYRAAFVTEQGVPARFGRQRQHLPLTAIEALRAYLADHSPVRLRPLRTITLI